MPKHFLIDYENVADEGLIGFFSLKEEDTVDLFYTDKASRIRIDFFNRYLTIRNHAKLNFIRVVSGNQALDMQLATYLGGLIGSGGSPDTEYNIISRDKGYLYILQFWKTHRPDISVSLDRTIDFALHADKRPRPGIQQAVTAETEEEAEEQEEVSGEAVIAPEAEGSAGEDAVTAGEEDDTVPVKEPLTETAETEPEEAEPEEEKEDPSPATVPTAEESVEDLPLTDTEELPEPKEIPAAAEEIPDTVFPAQPGTAQKAEEPASPVPEVRAEEPPKEKPKAPRHKPKRKNPPAAGNGKKPEDKPVPAETPAVRSANTAQAGPTAAKPAEAKPAEVKSAEVKPAEVKSAEAKPAKAKPAEKGNEEKKEPPKQPVRASRKPAAGDRSKLNDTVQQLMSKARYETGDIAYVASLAVKLSGEEHPKKAIYQGIISKFGQKTGIEIYNLIKKEIR